MNAYALGFDLSLRAPAAVALPLDWKPGDWKRTKAWLGKPPDPDSKDDYKGQMARYRWIADWASGCVKALGKAQVHGAVESYGFSKDTNMASRIMGSGEIVKLVLWERHGVSLRAFTASECRKRSLGFNPRRGPGDPRDHVKLVIHKMCSEVFKCPKGWGVNEYDALLVCQMLLSELGGKILAAPPPEKPMKKEGR